MKFFMALIIIRKVLLHDNAQRKQTFKYHHFLIIVIKQECAIISEENKDKKPIKFCPECGAMLFITTRSVSAAMNSKMSRSVRSGNQSSILFMTTFTKTFTKNYTMNMKMIFNTTKSGTGRARV